MGTNKLFQLKKLSSDLTATNSNSISYGNNISIYSHYNSYGNNSLGSNGFATLNKICQRNRDKAIDKNNVNVRVKYSEGAYQIKDLEEYKVLLTDKKTLETDKKDAF